MVNTEFPLSRVVRLMKEHTGEKQVSAKVKLATEQFLQDVSTMVAKDLNNCNVKTLNEYELLKCKRPFEAVVRMEEEHEAVVEGLTGLKLKMDQTIRDFRKKFDLQKEDSEDFYFDDRPAVDFA